MFTEIPNGTAYLEWSVISTHNYLNRDRDTDTSDNCVHIIPLF